jgi:hypothetical protein
MIFSPSREESHVRCVLTRRLRLTTRSRNWYRCIHIQAVTRKYDRRTADKGFMMEYTMPQATIVYTLFRALPVAILLVLLVNNIQRFAKTGWNAKRFATFYLALFTGGLFVITLLFLRFRVPDVYLVPVAVAAIIVLVILRGKFFPFRLRCTQCGAALSLRVILFGAEDLCRSCSTAARKEE